MGKAAAMVPNLILARGNSVLAAESSTALRRLNCNSLDGLKGYRAALLSVSLLVVHAAGSFWGSAPLWGELSIWQLLSFADCGSTCTQPQPVVTEGRCESFENVNPRSIEDVA